MVKLNHEVLISAPSRLNTIGDRELDLRALRILNIENLAITRDRNDCIDLTDNDLVRLENFPPMRKLSTLLLANNQISKVDPALDTQLPNLKVLILSRNNLQTFQDIDVILKFPKLEVLSLWENPVASKKNYRLYVIHKCPSLRLLDFRKIKEEERREAKLHFSQGR